MRLLALTLATSAVLIAPAHAQTQPQTGPFPLNSVTDREHDGPQGDQLRPSIKALQTTLTDPNTNADLNDNRPVVPASKPTPPVR